MRTTVEIGRYFEEKAINKKAREAVMKELN